MNDIRMPRGLNSKQKTSLANKICLLVEMKKKPCLMIMAKSLDLVCILSKEMKQNLGLTSGFPSALTLNPASKLSVPAIPFDKTAHSLNDKLINHEIYVTPTDKFQIKFRDIFVDTVLTHYSGEEARRWLSGPNMNLWNQQLN